MIKQRVYELVQNAQEIIDMVEKDGSWGMHGFKFTKQRLDASKEYIKEAQRILNKKFMHLGASFSPFNLKGLK